MNNLSDFANFGELQHFWREGGRGAEEGAPGGGCQTEVCATGAKNPCYASERMAGVGDVLAGVTKNISLKTMSRFVTQNGPLHLWHMSHISYT